MISVDRVTILNTIIAAGAAAMAAESAYLLHASFPVIPIAAIALITFGSYWFLRQDYYFKFPVPLINAIVIILIITECLFCFNLINLNYSNEWFQLKGWHIALLLPTVFVVVMYSRRTVNRPLRKVPYLKAFIIAYCWAVLTTLPIILFSKNAFEDSFQTMSLLIGQRFFFVLALTLMNDIIDLPKDNQLIRTLPMKFGKNGTILFVMLFLLISDLGLSAFFQFERFVFPALISSLPALFILLKSKNRTAETAVEAALILHALMVWCI